MAENEAKWPEMRPKRLKRVEKGPEIGRFFEGGIL
jgi:hypothetical protein